MNKRDGLVILHPKRRQLPWEGDWNKSCIEKLRLKDQRLDVRTSASQKNSKIAIAKVSALKEKLKIVNLRQRFYQFLVIPKTNGSVHMKASQTVRVMHRVPRGEPMIYKLPYI